MRSCCFSRTFIVPAYCTYFNPSLVHTTFLYPWQQTVENASLPGPSSRGISARPCLAICPSFCLLIANLPIFYCLLLSPSDMPLHPLNTEQWFAGKPRSLALVIIHNKPLQSYWCRPAIIICESGSQEGHSKWEWPLLVWVTFMAVTKCPTIKPFWKDRCILTCS